MSKILDYKYEYGDYADMKSVSSEDGFAAKMNAFLNLLHMRPGMHQDCPFMGIDMERISFAEGLEIDIVKNAIQSEILEQTSQYVDPNFIDDIRIETFKEPNSNTGETQIEMNLIFHGDKAAQLIIKTDGKTRKFESVVFDDAYFKEKNNGY